MAAKWHTSSEAWGEACTLDPGQILELESGETMLLASVVELKSRITKTGAREEMRCWASSDDEVAEDLGKKFLVYRCRFITSAVVVAVICS